MAAVRRPDPPPYRTNDYLPVIVGNGAWAIAFIVLLTRHGEMARNGQGWWLWVTVVGFALGLWGLVLVAIHHRVAAHRGEHSSQPSQPSQPSRPSQLS